MTGTKKHRSMTPGAAGIGLLLLISLVTACAHPAGPTDIERELAELRREHEAMREELNSLRRQLAVDQNDAAPSPVAEVRIAPAEESAASTLTLVLEVYRQSLEAGDLERIRSTVYGGNVPRDDDRLLETIVDRTEDLKLDLETRKLDMRGHQARLVVDHQMRFRLRVTQEERRARLALVMLFEEGPDGWHLVGIGRE